MLGDRLLEGADGLDVTAEGEQRVEAVLHHARTFLVEANDDRPDLVVGTQSGECRATPQRECEVEALERLLMVVERRRLPRRRREQVEPPDVDMVARDMQGVARSFGHQHQRRRAGHTPGLQHPAQTRHVALQGTERRTRRVLAPQLLDQPVNGDDAPGFEREVCHQRSLLGTTEVEQRSGTSDLDRTEQTDLELAGQIFRRRPTGLHGEGLPQVPRHVRDELGRR